MANRTTLLSTIGFTLISLMTATGFAQSSMTKRDALEALDEIVREQSRFDRVNAMARSLGVSEPRLATCRFVQAVCLGDFATVKQMLPEMDKAFANIPPDEAFSSDAQLRQMLPGVKK